MTTTPDPNRHEASRAAFEAIIYGPPYEMEIERNPNDETKSAWPGQYSKYPVALAWDVLCDFLDHAAAQVCGWTHDATNEEYDTDCARSFRCLVYGWDNVPGFCPGCGRRVKIINNETTTNTNK